MEELLLYEQDPTQDNQDSAKIFHQYIMPLFTGVNVGSGFVSA